MKTMDPENRYLVAFQQLGTRAQELYKEYGDLMEVMPPNRNRLARVVGASVNTVKDVIDFVELWGGPGINCLETYKEPPGPDNAHYIIPDAHFKRKDRLNNYRRAAELGAHMALTYRANAAQGKMTRFVCLGDWWDMLSLCFYEKDKASFALQSVAEDMQAGTDALDTLMRTFRASLDFLGVTFVPSLASFDFTNGNHELRLDKALVHREHGPMLKGSVQTHREVVEGLGWRFHDYMQPINIDGVAYAHCLPSGVMGRPIGGVTATKSLLDKMMVSCVVGHSHVWDITMRTDAFGGKRFAVVAGCYYDQLPEYAATTGQMWWCGVTILKGVRDGCLTQGYATATTREVATSVHSLLAAVTVEETGDDD